MDPIQIKRNVMKPDEEAIIKEHLKISGDLFTLVSFVADLMSQLLHTELLPMVEDGEIFAELLPALLGVKMSGNNWNILARKIVSIAIIHKKDNSQTAILCTLNDHGDELKFAFPVVPVHNDLWLDSPELVDGSESHIAVIYPPEMPCMHEGAARRSPSCKDGHIHRSIFHLGPDATEKYTAFDEHMSELLDAKEAEQKKVTEPAAEVG